MQYLLLPNLVDDAAYFCTTKYSSHNDPVDNPFINPLLGLAQMLFEDQTKFFGTSKEEERMHLSPAVGHVKRAPPPVFSECQPSLPYLTILRLKQLNLITHQVHADMLVADLLVGRMEKSCLKKLHLSVCLKLHL